MTSQEKIAILDCGAQYTKVIDRRIRELNVETAIFPVSIDPETLKKGFSGIILSGGPNSVYEPGSPRCHSGLFELGIPVLGICYGMQLVNLELGGTVLGSDTREYGETRIAVKPDHPLFAELDASQQVLMSHGDSVQELAPGFSVIGKSGGESASHSGDASSNDKTQTGASHHVIAAIANDERRIYGVQFHPEVELTENGSQMLANFLFNICKVTGSYVLEDRLGQSIAEIREKVGEQNVFVLVSGGVDSTVTAALLLKALGPEKVYAVHIDSGFMRENESTLVCEALKALGLKHLRRMNAEKDFSEAFTDMEDLAGKIQTVGPLHSVTDPETKRRIIGDVFYRLINQAISEAEIDLSQAFIAQGTLRPDLIESGNRDVSQTAHKIKTHHNDVPLIQAQREKGMIIEPNRDWHKDEVREVGRLLGLPEELVMRQPFPGPGLAIRVLCTEQPYLTERYDALSRDIQAYVSKHALSALVLPVQSVGVQGDGRTYSYLVALAGKDPRPDWEFLKDLARELPNKFRDINRVAWTLNRPELPESCKAITPTWLKPETVAKLRALDHQVTTAIRDAGKLPGINQLLTVLIPVDTSNQGEHGEKNHSVVIRGVVTSDYMTARPARLGDELPWALMEKLSNDLSESGGIDLVLYDLTSKPPATVEWE